MSIDTNRQKYKDLSSIKTEQGRSLLLRGNMTLPYSISGVTNPLENHSCSMILPYCSIQGITTHTLPNVILMLWKANMPRERKASDSSQSIPTRWEKQSLATHLEPQIIFKKHRR